jgi:hypothetical protein
LKAALLIIFAGISGGVLGGTIAGSFVSYVISNKAINGTNTIQNLKLNNISEKFDSFHDVKQNIANSTRDPESVKFRSLIINEKDGRTYTCGEFNAKNAYGGYVGYKKFYKENEADIEIEKDDLKGTENEQRLQYLNYRIAWIKNCEKI